MVIENAMKTRKQFEENLKKSYIVDGGEIRIGLNGDRGSNGILGTEYSFKKKTSTRLTSFGNKFSQKYVTCDVYYLLL